MKKFILVAFAALFVCSAVDAQILRAEELEKYAKEKYGEKWVDAATNLGTQLTLDKNNAITYTPAGSHIMISISVDDGRVACSVADDGPGIAPEDRERIFESFYTANHGLADSHRSVGLGLSLCRSIALAHGGSIEVAAADPHVTVFTIDLPPAADSND